MHEQDHLHPSLKTLLEAPAKNDPDHKSSFFTTLSTLIVNSQDNAKYWYMDEGYAIGSTIGDNSYVVAILRGATPSIPGCDTQRLILFDRNGQILDKLTCEINIRLTRMHANSGQFRTDFLDSAKDSDAQLVIRYTPEEGGSVAGNWSHEIIYQGKTSSFHWDQSDPNNIRSSEWESKGLCRVNIREGKLSVVFPQLKKAAPD